MDFELPTEEDVEVQAAAAKVGKYATSESGDTLEMIERPLGGVSFVLADGQSSGRGAKQISNLVARKAISLLAEGVRDGAAARAAHDYLRAQRQGKVSATLNIVSVDLATRTIVISRNSHCPVLVVNDEGLRLLDEPSEPIGIRARTRPVISELPLAAGTLVVVFTDGVWTAGQRYGRRLDVVEVVKEMQGGEFTAQQMADTILDRAVALDEGRPADDISVLVVRVVAKEDEAEVRRMDVRFPVR
ncbi:MAG: PP2C family protein-serine/threonine phosphatase [Anaerolineae bacterium]|nr:PP2C family protein-serine/threonine phosphatase [Anaerolineae bacterium]